LSLGITVVPILSCIREKQHLQNSFLNRVI
jgi:hypothetical protein